MSRFEPIPGTKRTDPLVSVGHPDFRWTTGADVQATWRRYGWVPPAELKSKPEDQNPTNHNGY